jgi:tetratricopeptide (TPR) repeat protein
LAYEQRHFDSAAVVLDSLIASRSDDIPTRRDAEFERAQVSEIGGRLAESDRHMGQARTLARQLGNRQATINAMLDSADQDSWYGIDRERALRTLDRTAATPLLDSLPPARRPYNRFVELYSRMGKPDKARAMLREAEALEQSKTAAGQRNLHAMRGMIARGERNYDEAIREFRASDGGGCNTCALPDLALTYDQAGNADSAIAVFARFTSGTGTAPGILGTWLALSHRRLGELYDGKGDADNAMSHYAQFVDLWKNADPELQPQVAKARERLKELQRRKG